LTLPFTSGKLITVRQEHSTEREIRRKSFGKPLEFLWIVPDEDKEKDKEKEKEKSIVRNKSLRTQPLRNYGKEKDR